MKNDHIKKKTILHLLHKLPSKIENSHHVGVGTTNWMVRLNSLPSARYGGTDNHRSPSLIAHDGRVQAVLC